MSDQTYITGTSPESRAQKAARRKLKRKPEYTTITIPGIERATAQLLKRLAQRAGQNYSDYLREVIKAHVRRVSNPTQRGL